MVPAAEDAAVDGRTAGKQRMGLSRTAVVLQRAEHWVSQCRRTSFEGAVGDIADIAHQVVADGRESARAVSECRHKAQLKNEAGLKVPSDDGVLEVESAAESLKTPPPVPVPLKSASAWLLVIVAVK